MRLKVPVIFLYCCMAIPALAALTTKGKGDAIQLVTNNFPEQMKFNYSIMRVKCVKCHNLERLISAIDRGVGPISGQPFDRNAVRAYGVKMMRRPDSGMKPQEIKATVDLMNYLIDTDNN